MIRFAKGSAKSKGGTGNDRSGTVAAKRTKPTSIETINGIRLNRLLPLVRRVRSFFRELWAMGTYSEVFMEHFASPRNSGAMDSPSVVGHAGAPGRGPFLILYLEIKGQVIGGAKYQTYGCGATIAAGSVLTELVHGKLIEECLVLTEQDVIEALDGVPSNKLHGPALAITALRDALKGFGPSGSETR